MLIGNGSGGYNFIATSSLGIGGSGSVGSGLAGQVAYYDANGSAVVGTSTLFIASSTNVGIGTNAPTASLHVRKDQNSVSSVFVDNRDSGTGAFASFVASNGANLFEYGMFGTGYTTNGLFRQGGAFLNSNAPAGMSFVSQAGAIRFGTGGFADANERLTIASTGNIGIGTTTPSASLHVRKDQNSINSVFVENRNTGTGAFAAVSTSNGSNIFEYGMLGTGYTTNGLFRQGGAFLNSNAPAGMSFVSQAGAIRFGTGGFADANERVTITSTGNVGIGSTTPVAKLSVGGHTQTNSLTILGGGTYEAGSIYSDASWGMLFRAKQNSPSGAIFRWSDASDSEQFRISTAGNMLVGTTTGSSKLSVSGNGYFYGDVSSEGSNQTRVNVTTNGSVSTALAGVKIANNGSGAVLENLSYGSANNGSTWFGLSSNNAVFSLGYGGSLAGYGIGTLTSSSLILGTNNAARIQIDGSGNVNTDSGTMYVDATHNTVGIGGTRSGAISATNPRFRITASTSSSLGSAFEIMNAGSASRLLFRDDGRLWLGDGTASYGESLNVTTSGTQVGLVLQTSGTGYAAGDGFRLQYQDVTGVRYFNYESAPHVFYIASNEVARFSSTGAVMQITGTLAAQYSGAGSSRGGAISLVSSAGTPQDWIMATAGNDNTIVNGRSWFLYDNTNSVARFFVDTNGNVGAGLGTATATARLHVRGTADPSFRGDYDASNYWTARTSSTGVTTFDATGTLPQFVLSDDTLVGTTTAVGKLTVSNNGGNTGVYADAYRHSADVYGGLFKANLISSGSGYYSYGVYAEATAGFDANGSYGVYGKVSGNFSTAGVYGVAGNYGAGVKGTANSADTQALVGEQSNASGFALYTTGGKNYIQNNLGIGTTTPGQKLVVVGNAQITAVTSGTYSSDLNLTSDGTLTTSASDIRLKENMLELSSDTLDKLGNIKAYTFNWKNDPEQRLDIGLIAQEVETVFPELVFTNKTDGFKGVNYSRLSVLLLKGFQEQQRLLGTTTTSLSVETTQTIIQEALSEANKNPITVIVDRTTQGVKTLTNFVAVRVTAVRGYFSELFTKEIITEKLCVTKTDGTKVCVNGDQLDNLLQNAGMNASNAGSGQTSSAGGGSTESSTDGASDTGTADTSEGQATEGGSAGESSTGTEGATGSGDTSAGSDTGNIDSSVSDSSSTSSDAGGAGSSGDTGGSSTSSSGGDAGGSAGSSATGGGDSGGTSSGSSSGGESSGGGSAE